jgi:hypothetical protein
MQDLKKRVETEPDFIDCPEYDNSLKKFVDAHPNGVDEKTIAKVMVATKDEVKKIYQSAIQNLRARLPVNIDQE